MLTDIPKSGPVKIVPVATTSTKSTSKPTISNEAKGDDETSSSGNDNSDESENESPSSAPESEVGSDAEIEDKAQAQRPRKRRRVAKDGAEDLEESYFRRLGREEEKEQRQRQAERGDPEPTAGKENDVENDDPNSVSTDSDDESMDDAANGAIPQHESLQTPPSDADKLKRTVFLGNVSTEAIKSKTAKRILSRHLRSVLKTPPEGKRPGKLESLRFRSTAYVSGSGPKKATFAKKELMDTTTKSTNAYAVFTTIAAADTVTEKLNGSIVLDRHLRVDSLGQPAEIDHRRCVFVGNLSFVDEETPDENANDGQSRPRGREPADPEEGLWRCFGKVGKVESVRVVRDQETRVSKGIAYVQFTNENSVEAALLLNEKRFPPMLPRKLRVMRAKKMKQKAPSMGVGANRHDRALLGLGKRKRQGARHPGTGANGVIFEGHRASSNTTSGGKSAKSKKKLGKRPDTRSSRRGANYKAAGGRNAKKPKRN